MADARIASITIHFVERLAAVSRLKGRKRLANPNDVASTVAGPPEKSRGRSGSLIWRTGPTLLLKPPEAILGGAAGYEPL